MKLPIRSQILWPLALLLLVAVVANALFAAWWASYQTRLAIEGRQKQIIGVIEESGFPLLAINVLEKLRRLTDDDFVVWDDVQKQIVVGTLADAPALQSDLQQARAFSADDSSSLATIGGQRYLIRSVKLLSKPGHRIVVLTSNDRLQQASRSAMWPPLAVGTATILLLIPLAVVLASFWAGRIRSLERHVELIARGEFGIEQSPDPIDDELSRLVKSINSMSRQLASMQRELVQGERTQLIAQLTAGFAHQVRNGLAGARLAIELHQSRNASNNNSSLKIACQQLALVEEEVRGLLTLGHADTKPRQPVDLVSLLNTVAKLVEPVCHHHGVDFLLLNQQDITGVVGLTDGIRSAVLNMTLNAIEATGPGGHVKLMLEKENGFAVIAVEDDGPGPPADLTATMFEPFVTAKKSGIGLGLAVANAVVQDHQGQLDWRRADEWTRFEIKLPLIQGGSDQNEPHTDR